MAKAKKYEIEFWLNNEAIDYKESNDPIIVPRVGENVHVVMENPNMGEGESYKVLEVKYYYFTSKNDGELHQKVMVDLEVQNNDAWKSQL